MDNLCHKCGNIKDVTLDYNAEWRYYGNEDSKMSDPTRCGLPTNELLPESSHVLLYHLKMENLMK